MAMTAWSAKVCSSAIWASENGPACIRETMIVPMGLASRNMGTAMMLLNPTTWATAPWP